MKTPVWPEARAHKFRQAAFAYLHVAILYEAAAFEMARHGMLPERFGPPAVWVVLGALVAGSIVLGLYWWQHVWLARVVWILHGLRLPALIRGAFFASNGKLPPAFYIVAIVVVMFNLWMLARAGWDV
jgi:hypothetical protein